MSHSVRKGVRIEPCWVRGPLGGIDRNKRTPKLSFKIRRRGRGLSIRQAKNRITLTTSLKKSNGQKRKNKVASLSISKKQNTIKEYET